MKNLKTENSYTALKTIIIVVFFLFYNIILAQVDFEWAKRAGGMSWEDGLDIATDASGNCFTTGYFSGTASFNSTTMISDGDEDIFIAKYDPSGKLLWAERAGGTLSDAGVSIATDVSGNCFIAGRFEGTASFNSTTLTSIGDPDIFIAKYDPSGNFLWAERAGGTGWDWGASIATDTSGNCFITGRFEGTASFNSTTLTSAGGGDIFIAKYDPSGNFLWAEQAGGTGNYNVSRIATDASGNCFITGMFSGTASFNSTTLTSIGDPDIFITKYDPSGNLLWAKRAGGVTGDEMGYGIATDASGNCFITGRFENTTSFNSITLTSFGSYDIFIAKYDASGNLLWAKRAGGTVMDWGFDIATDASGNCFITGSFESTASFNSITLTSVGGWDVFIAKYDPSGNVLWAKRAGGTSGEWGNAIATDASGNCFITGDFYNTASFNSTSLISAGITDIFVTKCEESEYVVIEAEDMQHQSWLGCPCPDGWKLTNGGAKIWQDVAVGSKTLYFFRLIAKAEIGGGAAPWLKVEIGDVFKGCCEINSTEWQPYNFCANIPAGTHRLTLTFLNDWWNKNTGEDRNLLLDKVQYTLDTISPFASAFVYQAEDMKQQIATNYDPATGLVKLRKKFSRISQDMYFEEPELTFIIFAKAEFADGGWPQMRFTIKDQVVGVTTVSDNDLVGYIFNVTNISSGKNRVKILYKGDSWTRGRKLYIDRLVVINQEGGLLKPVAEEMSHEQIVEVLPENFHLDQNYPNPFNPQTTLNYELFESRSVTLEIYNITGSKVITLVNGQQSAGHYSVTWDGRDDSDRSMAGGIYLCRIQAGEFQQTIRILLLK